ncbi:hypothetical protein MKL09_09810 [Methylobacterium sp. J-048]|uniref:hypothetical protein n=1 Tax=Methylobacterium sp. J-048 TaxID=2836635 RepID=UPI001FBA9278|nr:hypothetical protein [Methylobacterium sp. J-048]MCJ2056849.1 hypothetical protein [Methylobacterium sp. J-048]
MASRDHRQGTALVLVSEPPIRSVERQTLADALDLLAERQRGLENCRAAIRAAESMEAEAAGALHVAQADLNQAKEDRAAEITAAAAAGAAVPSSDRQRLARQRVGEAEDELEAVRQSVASVRVPLEDWEYWTEQANDVVRTAVADVAATELPAAIAVAMTAIKNAETCVRTAQLIYQAGADRRSHDEADKQRQATMNGLNALANGNWTTRDFSRGTAPNWLQAVARLRTDPDTAFPELQAVADLLPGEPGPGASAR